MSLNKKPADREADREAARRRFKAALNSAWLRLVKRTDELLARLERRANRRN